ncbi:MULTISPECIES: hypothetical protein [unclassified Chelatococcus]|uniref:cucumopine synthase-related protein n=1 Tax=unclassified Chelatococcus TaxID=2638111 RepID=UPI001BD0096D|nr:MULTISPECIES: hypothetical protein [unclassified Chelatococcus]MBS7701078.1 hypothetical protein [Chelatococcus sp. YT9]MBX3555611.1 hypothetical protein [Chelatococcus sp.]
MSTSEVQAIVAMIDAETAAIMKQEPEETKKLREGRLDDKAGAYGQYFGTWDIAAGMLRDCSMYALYPLLRLARQKRSDLNISVMVDEMLPPYTNYLGYSGFPTLERLGDLMRPVLREANQEDTDALLSAYLRYANRLYCWVYHYFPWNLGEHYRYPDDAEGRAADAQAARDAAAIVDGFTPSDTFIRLTWQPLCVSVRAWLAVDQNPELCRDLLNALPFTVLQEHPMVTGESMFAWTPLTTTAPVHVTEEIRFAPIGRLRFSQRTGQKLVVQYGATKETIRAPLLGAVAAEDKAKLPAIGRAVWDATYASKELIWLTVERA